ncbi:MAG: leucine-rich repeat domain-containing protein [Eggerthellaceae bacterium]|nr:leucine-rich repeat domain-containing protein [Eggerthellaceae bacterium]
MELTENSTSRLIGWKGSVAAFGFMLLLVAIGLLAFAGSAYADAGSLRAAATKAPEKVSSATSSYALYTANGDIVPCTKTGKQKAKAWSVSYDDKAGKFSGTFDSLKIKTLFIASNVKTVKAEGHYVDAYKGYKLAEYDAILGYIPCSKVSFLKNSKGVNSCTRVAKEAFADSSAKSFSNFDKTRVRAIGQDAFFSCKATSIALPNTLKSIGESAFSSCDNLKTVKNLEKTKVKAIAEGTFRFCKKLTSATLPATCASVGNSAFEGCESLTRITFGKNVKSIGDHGFASCSKLESVDLPASVKSLGTGAFFDATSLKSMTMRSETLVEASGPSKNVSLLLGLTPIRNGDAGAVIKVPEALVDEYKASSAWKVYESVIQAL